VGPRSQQCPAAELPPAHPKPGVGAGSSVLDARTMACPSLSPSLSPSAGTSGAAGRALPASAALLSANSWWQ